MENSISKQMWLHVSTKMDGNAFLLELVEADFIDID